VTGSTESAVAALVDQVPFLAGQSGCKRGQAGAGHRAPTKPVVLWVPRRLLVCLLFCLSSITQISQNHCPKNAADCCLVQLANEGGAIPLGQFHDWRERRADEVLVIIHEWRATLSGLR